MLKDVMKMYKHVWFILVHVCSWFCVHISISILVLNIIKFLLLFIDDCHPTHYLISSTHLMSKSVVFLLT